MKAGSGGQEKTEVVLTGFCCLLPGVALSFINEGHKVPSSLPSTPHLSEKAWTGSTWQRGTDVHRQCCPAQNGFLSSRWQKAGKQVTCCLAHCPLALHLFSYSRKAVPLAPRGSERSRNLPKWWQAVPEDPGRMLHKVVNTGKSCKQDTSF